MAVNNSIDCCGSFDESNNMSDFYLYEAVEVIGNVESTKGVLGSLEKKGILHWEDISEFIRGKMITNRQYYLDTYGDHLGSFYE